MSVKSLLIIYPQNGIFIKVCTENYNSQAHNFYGNTRWSHTEEDMDCL